MSSRRAQGADNEAAARGRVVISRYRPGQVDDGAREDPRRSASRGQNFVKYYRGYNIRVLLCGAADSSVSFTPYRGHLLAGRHYKDNFSAVPLFDRSTDVEVCRRFQEKLELIAGSVEECETLNAEQCRLQVHLRIGDFYIFDKSFNFRRRPRPPLGEFNLLLDTSTFAEGRNLLDGLFRWAAHPDHMYMSTIFCTEKHCGSHDRIEAFLEMRGLEAIEGAEECVSTSLNGDRHKYELFFYIADLQLQDMTMISEKWNLDLVTAKGSNYRGSFREVADIRLQVITSFESNTSVKVAECLHRDGFQVEELRHLFARADDAPAPGGAGDAEDLPTRLRLTHPHLAERLEYVRVQSNRSYVLNHDRWPFVVKLRRFWFADLARIEDAVLTAGPEVQFRVSAGLQNELERQSLSDPELVSHLWNCCQLMQDLVAASLEAE